MVAWIPATTGASKARFLEQNALLSVPELDAEPIMPSLAEPPRPPGLRASSVVRVETDQRPSFVLSAIAVRNAAVGQTTRVENQEKKTPGHSDHRRRRLN